MRIVLVCGGRNYSNGEAVDKMLDSMQAIEAVDLVVHGGADGADKLAAEWAESRGVHCASIPALWFKAARAAGPMRNRTMLNLVMPHACEVVAFPGGAGTDHMVSIARKAGVHVWEVSDDI